MVAHELEHAVAGSMFVVCREGDDLGGLRRQVPTRRLLIDYSKQSDS